MEDFDPERYLTRLVVDNYPVYRLPDRFRQDVQKGVNGLLVYPLEPVKPPKPQSPASLSDYVLITRLLVLFFMIIVVGQFATASYPMVNEGERILGTFVLMALSGGISRKLRKIEDARYALFLEKMNQYNRDLDEYEMKVEMHERKTEKIRTAKRTVKILRFPIPYSIGIYLESYLKESPKPSRINRVGARGKAESRLGIHLRRVFGDKILESHAICSTQKQNSPGFEPDFIYFDESRRLSIVIEIDEPYTLVDRSPIHINAEIGSFREEFFMKNRWFIVRFSEEQAVKNPESCCKEIALFVFWLTGFSVTDLLENSKIPLLRPTRTWSYEDAQKMAIARTREAYL